MKWDSTDKGKEWHKNYDARNIRFEVTFRKESGIMEALDKACAVHGISKADYLRKSVTNKMRKDGFCRPKDKNNHSLFSCEALNTVIK